MVAVVSVVKCVAHVCFLHLPQSQFSATSVSGGPRRKHITLFPSYPLSRDRFTSCLRGVLSAPSLARQASMQGVDMDVEAKMDTEKLNKEIAEYYDKSSGMVEDIWGDHMHHGFYDPSSTVSLPDHRSAQIRMIEEALQFASVSDEPMKKPKSIVDVGCGLGGSSRYLAKKYGAECVGINISPVQVERARALTTAQGLENKVSFEVADALNQPFPDGKFDLVWSLESGEHMPNKAKFVNELARVAAPGATIVIVTWCHRDLSSSEQSLNPDEKKLLDKMRDACYIPAWCSTDDYVRLLQSLSLQDIRAADWSEYIEPFWPAMMRLALSWKGITSLRLSGWKTIKGALAMPLMDEAYKKGLIKFAIITCRKPE